MLKSEYESQFVNIWKSKFYWNLHRQDTTPPYLCNGFPDGLPDLTARGLGVVSDGDHQSRCLSPPGEVQEAALSCLRLEGVEQEDGEGEGGGGHRGALSVHHRQVQTHVAIVSVTGVRQKTC